MPATDTYDWTQFDVHIFLPCDAAAAYDCWATSHGMEGFFTQAFTFTTPGGTPRDPDERAQAGDAYHLAFHHADELTGTVLACEPGREFAFSFGSMRVTVSFEEMEGRTLVRLVQSEIPTDDAGRAHSHLNCRSCWVYYLLNLRSVIEHGIDLRDAGLPDNPVSIDFLHRWRETQA